MNDWNGANNFMRETAKITIISILSEAALLFLLFVTQTGSEIYCLLMLSVVYSFYYFIRTIEVFRLKVESPVSLSLIFFTSLVGVLFFSFQYWIFSILQPQGFLGLGQDPISAFHTSLMNFVFSNTVVVPVTTTAKILTIIQTLFAYAYFAFLLSNLYLFKVKN